MKPKLNGNSLQDAIGLVTFVGAGPGDPELITRKGWSALQAADVVLYDSLVDARAVAEVPGELIYVGKRCGNHAMPQEKINDVLARHALAGYQVVRLKGGDGAVLGRLGEELLYLAEREIPYEVVPGVTSATSVPAFAGIPVTHRGLADSFTVITAHRREDDGHFSIPPFSPTTTLVLLMSLGTTPQWCSQLLSKDYPAKLPVAFVSSGGNVDQRVLVTTIQDAAAELAEARLPSPALAIVGQVVTLREKLEWFSGLQVASDDQPVVTEVMAESGQIMAGD